MIEVNGLRVTMATLSIPWSGIWVADLDLDLDEGQSLPTGKCTLTLGGRTCIGVSDPRYTGTYGQKNQLRVLGGAGGWGKEVAAQHYHNSGGVKLSAVAATTAELVGESVAVANDIELGPDYVRAKSRASAVLDTTPWHVGLNGITVVGERQESTPQTPIVVLDFDPLNRTLRLDTIDIVEPGTKLTGDLFGTVVLQDVEITASADGFRTVASTFKTENNRLLSALQRAASRVVSPWAASHRYRVVSDGGAELGLQAVEAARGLPDVVAAQIWHGAPGISAQLKPGCEVLLQFVGGDPRNPIVTAFEPESGAGFLPINLTINAVAQVRIGDASAQPVALAAQTVSGLNAIATALATIGGAFTTVGAVPLTGAAAGAAVASAITTLTGSLGSATATLPTSKLVAQ